MSTIMLVDDSVTILLSISSILGKAGYAVEKCSNAEEALRKLTAVTLMFPVMMLIVALQTMVSSGMASIVARRIGADDLPSAQGAVTAANLLALLVASLLILALALVGEPLTETLSNGDAELARMGLTFVAIMVSFSPLSFLLSIQGNALRSEGKVGATAAISLAMTGLNIALSSLLIGWAGLGVAGSAAGTVLAQARRREGRGRAEGPRRSGSRHARRRRGRASG